MLQKWVLMLSEGTKRKWRNNNSNKEHNRIRMLIPWMSCPLHLSKLNPLKLVKSLIKMNKSNRNYSRLSKCVSQLGKLVLLQIKAIRQMLKAINPWQMNLSNKSPYKRFRKRKNRVLRVNLPKQKANQTLNTHKIMIPKNINHSLWEIRIDQLSQENLDLLGNQIIGLMKRDTHDQKYKLILMRLISMITITIVIPHITFMKKCSKTSIGPFRIREL